MSSTWGQSQDLHTTVCIPLPSARFFLHKTAFPLSDGLKARKRALFEETPTSLSSLRGFLRIQKQCRCAAASGGPWGYTLPELVGTQSIRAVCTNSLVQGPPTSLFQHPAACQEFIGDATCQRVPLLCRGLLKPGAESRAEQSRAGQQEMRRAGCSRPGLSPALAEHCKQHSALTLLFLPCSAACSLFLGRNTLSSPQSYPDSYLIYSVKQAFSGKVHESTNY